MSDWQKAIERYRRANEPKPTMGSKPTRKPEPRPNHTRAVRDLESFLSSPDGESARRLLAASRRHINFGERREGGGYGVVYFLDGEGLHCSVEAMGQWTVYAKDVPEPRISPITAQEATEVAMDPAMGGRCRDSEDIVHWLRSELDRIAEAAP